MQDETTTEIQEKEPIETAAPVEETAATEESGENDEQNLEESASSEGEHKEEGQKAEKKGGFQRKVDKLTRRAGDAEREAKYWRDEALRNRPSDAKDGKTEQKVTATAETSNPEPKLADFDDWDAFNAANREWMRKEARRIATEEVSAVEKRRADEKQKQEQETETQRQQKEFDAREERASKKHKDWEEIAGTNDEPTVLIELHALHAKKQPGVPAIADVLGKADPDGDLEYYFASNPAEIARIAALEPVRASLELGKLLGTKLAPQESSASTATAAGGTTKALPPPRTLSKTAPTATAAGADLKDEEYFARREKQIAEAQRKGRKR